MPSDLFRKNRSLDGDDELDVSLFQNHPSLIDDDQINVFTLNQIKTQSIDGERSEVPSSIGP